jgi:hypothetical protein
MNERRGVLSAKARDSGDRSWSAAVRRWVIRHDDSWLFVATYIGLAVVLSIWISLFWLVAVVAAHFALEFVRQQYLQTGSWPVIPATLWELKLDVALVLLALVISLYMEVVLGVVGLQSAARAGVAAQAGLRGGSRFAAWQRVIRGVLLSLDDAAQVARVVTTGSETDGVAEERRNGLVAQPGRGVWGRWGGRWGRADWIAVGLGAAGVLLIVLAPVLTHHTFGSVIDTLAAELHPFPVGD